MSTLVKSNGSLLFKSLMEDIRNAERFLSQPAFNAEALPAVNIRDNEKNYEIEVVAPGFKKDDFKVTTGNGLLTISAEASSKQKVEHEKYTRKEFSRSAFTRTFSLPEDVVEDNISATYQDGLLKLEVERSGKSLTAKIEVKVA